MPGQGSGDGLFFVWSGGIDDYPSSTNWSGGPIIGHTCRAVHQCTGQGLGIGPVHPYELNIEINEHIVTGVNASPSETRPLIAVAVGKQGTELLSGERSLGV